MTSESAENASGSHSSEMVRPNFTIKQRQNKLLDTLAKSRYASRSEALRAAIETHAQSVNENGETSIEQLITRVEQLITQLNEIEERFDELEHSLTPQPVPTEPDPSSTRQNTNQVTDAVDTISSTQSTVPLENEVYTQLSERGAMSVLDITEHIDGDVLDVRSALDRLDERGFITCTEHGEANQYRVKEPTTN